MFCKFLSQDIVNFSYEKLLLWYQGYPCPLPLFVRRVGNGQDQAFVVTQDLEKSFDEYTEYRPMYSKVQIYKTDLIKTSLLHLT